MKVLRKRAIWILLALFLLPVLLFFVWYSRQVRQQQLDHALIEAIKKNETQKAIALLNLGADANATDKPYQPMTFPTILADAWKQGRGNQPPLHTKYYPSALLLPYTEIAVKKVGHAPFSDIISSLDNPALIEALLEHGANPYTIDDTGTTILYHAVSCHHSATVKVLLEHHMNPNIHNSNSQNGETPLMRADFDCARMLVAHGADVNARNNSGWTPLSFPNSLKTCKLLLDNGADVNAIDGDGRTILMSEVLFQANPTITQLLIEQGAKVAVKDRSGKTAVDYAKANKQKYVTHLLEAALKKELAEQHATEARTR